MLESKLIVAQLSSLALTKFDPSSESTFTCNGKKQALIQPQFES